MKKTLLVTSDYYPHVGGVARYYTKLCEGLDAEKVMVLHVGAEQSSAHFDIGNRAEASSASIIIRYRWVQIIPHWLQSVWFIWRAVKNYNIEIVWVGNILPSGSACLILKKLGLIKEYIVSVHGLDINLAFQHKPTVTKNILKNARYITANSRFTKGLMVEKGIGEGKIKVVYPGVSAPPLSPPAKGGKLGRDVVLLTVARLVKRKGIDDVIKALPAVWEKYPNVIYKIVGEGPERENLERLAAEIVGANGRSPVRGNIEFLGELSGEELESVYNEAHIFILTPKQIGPDVEGFGIVYLEANVHGLPVIASRTGGVPEAVEDGVNGLLVEPEDTVGITDAVVRLCSDQVLRKQLGTQGQGRVKDFSWQKSGQELQSLFEY